VLTGVLVDGGLPSQCSAVASLMSAILWCTVFYV